MQDLPLPIAGTLVIASGNSLQADLIMRYLAAMMIALFGSLCFAKDPETLMFSFQKQKAPEELQTQAKQVADFLSKEIGVKVEVMIPMSYGASVQALISNKVQVAYMDSLPYILAKKEAPVEIIAVEKRNGRTDYDSLLVVRKDSPIKEVTELKGKKMAFTSQTSTSGYLMPLALLVQEKQVSDYQQADKYFSQILYAGGYDKALQAVVSGQADAAAFSDYVIEGVKADLYGTKEQRNQIRILKRNSGVPTHLIAVRSDLSKQLKTKIQAALMKLSQQQGQMLSSVYGAAELIAPADTENHIVKTRQALKDTGLDAKTFVK